jgi:hypothetical protein
MTARTSESVSTCLADWVGTGIRCRRETQTMMMTMMGRTATPNQKKMSPR